MESLNSNLIHLISVLNETLKILTEYGIELEDKKGPKAQEIIYNDILAQLHYSLSLLIPRIETSNYILFHNTK